MANSRNREFVDDNHVDQNNDEWSSSSINGVVETSNVESGLTERLRDIFVDQNDDDLLLQQSDRDDRVLQWLQALDMQVFGACRSDERLKPLLKLNASNGVVEDRLLAHLSQHFEPSEVGMLARCFCIPLVSIRVGKIDKQGIHFQPTAIRYLWMQGYRASQSGRDVLEMARPFWNTVIIPSRRVSKEVEPRTDFPDIVNPLDPVL